MSVKCQSIISAIEEIAPKNLAESWDNVGLMVGGPEECIDRVLITLDITYQVIDFASSNNYQMIISHHPLIFKPIKSVRYDLPLGKKLLMLIKNNICVYSAHTNYDVVKGGVNDILCDILGVKNTSVLSSYGTNDKGEYGLGRIGKLDETISLGDFAKKIKDCLDIDDIRISGDLATPVKKVVVCNGSGASEISKSAFAGASVLVTGDVKHHDALDALEMGLCVIDAGHYATEVIALKSLSDYLKNVKRLKDITFDIYPKSTNPIFTV